MSDGKLVMAGSKLVQVVGKLVVGTCSHYVPTEGTQWVTIAWGGWKYSIPCVNGNWMTDNAVTTGNWLDIGIVVKSKMKDGQEHLETVFGGISVTGSQMSRIDRFCCYIDSTVGLVGFDYSISKDNSTGKLYVSKQPEKLPVTDEISVTPVPTITIS